MRVLFSNIIQQFLFPHDLTSTCKFSKSLENTIDQTQCYTHGTNTKPKEGQQQFFIPRQLRRDNGASLTVSHIFIYPPNVFQCFHYCTRLVSFYSYNSPKSPKSTNNSQINSIKDYYNWYYKHIFIINRIMYGYRQYYLWIE